VEPLKIEREANFFQTESCKAFDANMSKLSWNRTIQQRKDLKAFENPISKI